MAILQSVEEKRRWTMLHDMLSDLLHNPGKLDAVTDTLYQMVWAN